jgi:hypothetical protein
VALLQVDATGPRRGKDLGQMLRFF